VCAMKWQDVSESDLKGALSSVVYGHDPVATRNLIEYFYERIHNGTPYNECVLREYLDHAFGKIIEDGWTADHAFGFKLKRGHHERQDTTERDVVATAYMILLMRRNWTWLDAKGAAANLLFPDGEGEKAVEAAYALYKEALQLLPDNVLNKMLPPGTPVISRDMTV